jgi:hypothetical protein
MTSDTPMYMVSQNGFLNLKKHIQHDNFKFTKGDIISMEFDVTKMQLQISNDYTCINLDVKKLEADNYYRFAIALSCSGDTVEILSNR